MVNKIYCEKCGAEIRMIKMNSGKFMPVDSEMVTVVQDNNARGSFVTLDGGVIRGHQKRGFHIEEECMAFVSHFATCPASLESRKN